MVFQQNTGTFIDRRAGRIDIVHQEDAAIPNQVRGNHLERLPYIGESLCASQFCLGNGRSGSDQGIPSNAEMSSLVVFTADHAIPIFNEQVTLIESPLPEFGAV